MVKAISRTDLDSLADNTKTRMAEFVAPYVTPISRSDDMQHGWAWGTGNYLRFRTPSLITNKHIAVNAPSRYIAHLPEIGEDYHLLRRAFQVWPHPADLAITRLEGPPGPSRREITIDQLDLVYQPAQAELLFWLGFPSTTGKRHDEANVYNTRYSWFGELETAGIPVVSQELTVWPGDLSSRFLRSHHVLVHYPAQAQSAIGAELADTKSPYGMSGSLLWDTKRVACVWAGVDWEPSFARVCGILWATWKEPDLVVATKVEHVRDFLLATV